MKVNRIIVLNRNISISDYINNSLIEEGFGVYLVSNIDGLKSELQNSEYSLIICTDSDLTEVNSIDIKLPKLILIGGDTADNKNAGEYFIKTPFSFQTFLKKVKDIIFENDLDSNEIHIDTLNIDMELKKVNRGLRPISLTKKEYSLLVYLAKNKDMAVPRNDLIEKIWGLQIDPFSNTIEAHIFSLRKKIDGGESVKLIQTIPKFGYKISACK